MNENKARLCIRAFWGGGGDRAQGTGVVQSEEAFVL